MKRFILFVATNLLVVLTISILVNLLGLNRYLDARGINYQALLVFCAVWGFAGAFISLQLSRWIAKMSMGVQVIDPRRQGGALESKLVERVRSLCQRANLDPLPEIGIYASPEVNAFATGPSRSRSLLAVSSGLLERMDDRAVEGVLGHEIAHIANGDMVTMTLLQGVVNTFVMFLARILAFALGSAMSRDDDERPSYFMQYMLVQVLEMVLMLLAMPIIFWFSRHREYRADEGSARLSSPQTMIHALQSLARAAGMVDERAPALSTFKIAGSKRAGFALLFSTHPPIESRIEKLKQLA